MPGRPLMPPRMASRESRKTAVYKLALPRAKEEETPLNRNAAFRIGRQFHKEYRNLVQPRKTPVEPPVLEHFKENAQEQDRCSSLIRAISHTTNTTTTTNIDDIGMAMELGRLTPIDDFVHARHSTACCTDLALQREHPSTVDEGDLRDTSFAVLRHSFRCELEKEVRAESLALWEEMDQASSRKHGGRKQVHTGSHSEHGTTTTCSRRNKGLDMLLRKKKAFLNCFFSGLSFSSSRRSRKYSIRVVEICRD